VVEIFIVIAILLGGAGLISLSNATLGVGLIGLALLSAVLARITQASNHHRRQFPPKPPLTGEEARQAIAEREGRI
jgi:hypothetical protein